MLNHWGEKIPREKQMVPPFPPLPAAEYGSLPSRQQQEGRAGQY